MYKFSVSIIILIYVGVQSQYNSSFQTDMNDSDVSAKVCLKC